MINAPEKKQHEDSEFGKTIARKEKRRRKARQEQDRTLWFGLGTFGLVGWSVAIPMLVCTAIGIWIDEKTHGQYSWTLMLMLIGLVIGCVNAWCWVNKERKDE
jgi:ATP synthase protein I